MKTLAILGTRGIPAQHGGFETFAEHLALYLATHGWAVTVYCQVEDERAQIEEDRWKGVRLIRIPITQKRAYGTIVFDWRSYLHVLEERTPYVLVLGYNTAVFNALLRVRGVSNLINMDGLEWQRAKWRLPERAWLWLNERLGCWFGTHLIADHPEIAEHLATRVSREKITTIPYGADAIASADTSRLAPLGVTPFDYVLMIARAEPENSILEVVRSFSRKPRGYRLVILGKYDIERNAYHRAVLAEASSEVLFVGAIYDQDTVKSLRYFAHLYIHGHQVGGTNPSLVEALGAGSPILAHDNVFNRWVAGEGACYFGGTQSCDHHLDRLLNDGTCLEAMREASRMRHRTAFTWERVMREYESLLSAFLPPSQRAR